MTARRDHRHESYKLVSGPVPLVSIGANAWKPSRHPRALFVRRPWWRRMLSLLTRGVL